MKKWILPLALLGCLTCNSAIAATWFVNHAASGASSGTSWKDAFTNLQPAIDAAASGDTIWVAKGTYLPTVAADGASTNDRDKAFVLKSGVHIFGGFSGTETSFSGRATDETSLYQTNLTKLDGDLGAAGDAADNAYHVVVAIGVSDFTLNGFAIENANGDDMTSLTIKGVVAFRNYGGAIYNNDATGTYSDLLVQHNTVASTDDTKGGGGGMFNEGSDVTIENATFQNNKAGNCNGGAILNEASSPTVTGVLFKDNEASGSDEGGGAIDNRDGSDAVFTNVVFDGNTATNNSGGGIYNDGSSPILTDVVFKNNHAGGSGGGMDCDGGSDAILTNVQFINNSADEDGGGLYGWKSSATLTNVTFSGNHAENNGGGMYNYNTCEPVLTNVTFEGNTAGDSYGGFGLERDSKGTLTNILAHHNKAVNNGGGIGTAGSNTTIILTNATIVNNSATVGGGGYDQGTTTQIRNSIIVGNYPDNVDANNALMALVKHVIIEDGSLPISPVLVKDGGNPLSSVGVSWPFFVDTAANNYQLIAGSDAIDAGDSSVYASSATPDLSSIVTDLRGADRTIGGNTDIGAYEVCKDTLTVKATLSVSPGNEVADNASVTFTLSLENEGNSPVIEWYKNSSLIAGVSGTTYAAVAGVDFNNNDTIHATVHSSEGCALPGDVTSNKEVMTVNTTGIGTVDGNEAGLNIYPNPNDGTFTLSGHFDAHKTYSVTITNILGQRLYHTAIHPAQNNVSIAPGTTLAPGLYFLSVQEEGNRPQTIRFSVR